MIRLRRIGLSLSLLLASTPCVVAQKHLSVDTGECSSDMPATEITTKSPTFTDKIHQLNAFGVVSIYKLADDAKKIQCHVVYQLFVSAHGGPTNLVERHEWDTEGGEIAGIDIIGVSADGSKFASDFWLAGGDGEEHRPVVYDAISAKASTRSLGNKILMRIHNCDHNEDFIGVTNAGEAIFAVPPSTYDDSPECGDKGLWHFNLRSGLVYRVAKISGDKWR